MKILVVCQHYWPEPYPLTETCEELARRGHEVHVVTDIPNYPAGDIYPGYILKGYQTEERNGVIIHRTFTIPRKTNPLFRVMNYYSYSLSSTNFVKSLPGDFDVVFTNQTSPIMMVRAAMAYGKKWNKKVLLYCMDLWPASLSAGGVSGGSVYNHYLKVSRKLYGQADEILITSKGFQDYLTDVIGIEKEKIDYLPQYAGDEFTQIKTDKNKKTVDLMFAGNVGRAQSIDTVLKAAKVLQDKGNDVIKFHILGDGSELENLKNMANELELNSITFYGRRPKEEMPEFYGKADALLLMLMKDETISRTLPGKAQSYMAAGKPIIAAANGEIKRVMEEADCGYCVPAEDYGAFADAMEQFANNPDKDRLGNNSLRYCKEHFSKKKIIDQLEKKLKELAK